MDQPSYVQLPSRGLLSLSGPDTADLLQGLISQDIGKVSPTRAAYGALLTPQGKYLHDFLIVRSGQAIVLDCEAARLGDLETRLRRYRLRSDVVIEDRTGDLQVFAIFGGQPEQSFGLPGDPGAATDWQGGKVYVDPRRFELGCRAILPAEDGDTPLLQATLSEAPLADYDEHRARLGVPDGSRDIQVEKSTLLEVNLDRLNGIDWQKGCYVGQEITARTRHRGLLKRRLLTVRLSESAAPGTTVTCNGETVGELRSVAGYHALALMRLGAVSDAAEFRAGPAILTVEPDRT